jgi:hypothetical protein
MKWLTIHKFVLSNKIAPALMSRSFNLKSSIRAKDDVQENFKKIVKRDDYSDLFTN